MSFRELVAFFSHNKKEHLPPKFVIENVPYFSQWESPSLIGKIITHEVSAKNDPLWKSSGASSPEEYEFWARNMCGMACLKMIIKHKFGKTVPIVDLGKKCSEYGGYVIKKDAIDGLYYSPFVKFIKNEFNLTGEVVGSLSTEKIVKELSSGNYVIASVGHKIRRSDSQTVNRGGHLILMLGYDLENKKFIFHNPSGDQTANQKYTEIPFSQFHKFFAERGIAIKNS